MDIPLEIPMLDIYFVNFSKKNVNKKYVVYVFLIVDHQKVKYKIFLKDVNIPSEKNSTPRLHTSP